MEDQAEIERLRRREAEQASSDNKLLEEADGAVERQAQLNAFLEQRVETLEEEVRRRLPHCCMCPTTPQPSTFELEPQLVNLIRQILTPTSRHNFLAISLPQFRQNRHLLEARSSVSANVDSHYQRSAAHEANERRILEAEVEDLRAAVQAAREETDQERARCETLLRAQSRRNEHFVEHELRGQVRTCVCGGGWG